MTAESGHHPNRAYFAQDGSLHLNGANAYDVNEVDFASDLASIAGYLDALVAGSLLVPYLLTGADETMDADYTATGVTAADTVQMAVRLNTAAAIETATLIAASDFTCGVDTITRSSNAENNTNDQILVVVLKG